MNKYKGYGSKIIITLMFAILCISSQFSNYLVSANSTPTIIESGTIENINYTLDDEGCLTLSGTGAIPSDFSMKLIVLPDMISSIIIEEGITEIGTSAFYGYSSLESVTLAQSINSIGSSAFGMCNSLTNINLHNNISYLGGNVFMECTSLKSIKLPINTNFVSKYLFIGSGIETVYACCDFDITTFYKETSTNSHGDTLFSETDMNVVFYEHLYKDWVMTQTPTYTTLGEKTKTCYCGEFTETQPIDMLVQPRDSEEKKGLSAGAIMTIIFSIVFVSIDLSLGIWLSTKFKKKSNDNNNLNNDNN